MFYVPLVNLSNTSELQAYQKYIYQSPFGQITQDPQWRHIKTNWEPYYIYLQKNGEITAAASILVGESPYGKRFAYCSKGPVMDMTNLELFEQLVAECRKYLMDKYIYLLKFDPEIIYTETLTNDLEKRNFHVLNKNVSQLGLHGTIQPRLNMVIDLNTYSPSLKSVYDIVPSKTKNKLRRAQRDGITVTYGLNQALLQDFYHTYKMMSIRHGISYRPKEYFERMVATYRMRIYIAYKEDKAYASGIAFKCGDKLWYMYAGSIDGPLYNAPYTIQEEMIQWAIDTNVRYYDMGGIEKADNSDSLYSFKRNFVRQSVSEYIGEIDCVFDELVYQKMIAEKMPDTL